MRGGGNKCARFISLETGMIQLSMRRNLFLHHFLPSPPPVSCWRVAADESCNQKVIIRGYLRALQLSDHNSSRLPALGRRETMTLLHINFPPDAWPLILFASSHPPLPPQETALLPPPFIFQFSVYPRHLYGRTIAKNRYDRVYEMILLENFLPSLMTIGKS